ncbi:MAG: hypothetical protein HC871_10690 [Rhizobiales bacterium]|nr:hypothetical protein [Hyphomicrobiales bacterium]
MTGSIPLADERRRRLPLGRRARMKLEASFWSGLLVVGWETAPFRTLFVAETPPYAGWIALGLAGVAAVTAMQVKWRLRQRQAAEQAPKVIQAPNPLTLAELLHRHGVREFGSKYLYMPMPRHPRDDAAWAWVETLQAERLIKGDPWLIRAERVKDDIRQNHGDLFADDTAHFEVYRLDWQALHQFVGDEVA